MVAIAGIPSRFASTLKFGFSTIALSDIFSFSFLKHEKYCKIIESDSYKNMLKLKSNGHSSTRVLFGRH